MRLINITLANVYSTTDIITIRLLCYLSNPGQIITMKLLEGKVAIVTGSSKGIGRAIAIAFAEEGAKVVVNSRHKKEADRAVKDIRVMGHDAIAVGADVSNAAEVKRMFRKAISMYGKVDILVNNAGIAHFCPLTDITEKEWDLTIDVNLKGQFLCSKEAVSDIRRRKARGVIINIASIAGEVGFRNLAHYCASKGGIIELTRELALELSPDIRVNAIGPGVILTDMTKGLLSSATAKRNLLKSIPMGRIGKPEDIARAAVFLASDESAYITGQTMFVDGGWLTQ
jgi:NAD(P)-dependent dehydrogenase (short-subunit alcohol dehydrogenase family)